jgi:hypothetical protein
LKIKSENATALRRLRLHIVAELGEAIGETQRGDTD